LVESEFSKYDKDGSGTLSPAEFRQWITDLKTQEAANSGKPADAAATKQYAASAWKAADKNQDGVVTKAEFEAFLAG
jgi:Ca2+-binding EF-hand superfamily protein